MFENHKKSLKIQVLCTWKSIDDFGVKIQLRILTRLFKVNFKQCAGAKDAEIKNWNWFESTELHVLLRNVVKYTKMSDCSRFQDVTSIITSQKSHFYCYAIFRLFFTLLGSLCKTIGQKKKNHSINKTTLLRTPKKSCLGLLSYFGSICRP